MSLERSDRTDLLGEVAERLLDATTAAGVLDAAVDAGSDALGATAAVAFLSDDDSTVASDDGAPVDDSTTDPGTGSRTVSQTQPQPQSQSQSQSGSRSGSGSTARPRRRGAAIGVADGAGDGDPTSGDRGSPSSLAEIPSVVVDDARFDPVAVDGRADGWLADWPAAALEDGARRVLDTDGDGSQGRSTAVVEWVSDAASGGDARGGPGPAADGTGATGQTLLASVGARGFLAFGVTAADGVDARDRRLAARVGSLVARALDRADRERALREENDRLSTFASAVAHDLKNPLSVASGYLELELARTAPAETDGDGAGGLDGNANANANANTNANADANERRNLRAVADAVSRATDIVENLLVLARSRDVAAGETVALDEAVADAWSDVDASDDRLWVDPAVGSVRCEPGLLRQLLVNLLSNAVSHGDPGCEVRVLAHPDGFAVENDGDPVPVASRSAVFEPGRSGDHNGTGLGLAVVDRIAGAHGWSVAAAESPAGDPRFEVTGVDALAGHGPESDRSDHTS